MQITTITMCCSTLQVLLGCFLPGQKCSNAHLAFYHHAIWQQQHTQKNKQKRNRFKAFWSITQNEYYFHKIWTKFIHIITSWNIAPISIAICKRYKVAVSVPVSVLFSVVQCMYACMCVSVSVFHFHSQKFIIYSEITLIQ